MRVSLFGMGYVGVATGACLAADGHEVIGVDVNPDKVELLRSGRSPVVEEGLSELVSRVVAEGRLRATTDPREAVLASEVSLISVGTPSRPGGGHDLRAVETVTTQVGEVLATKDAPHTLVVRSTVLPGTTRQAIIPVLERASGRRCGEALSVCYNPEFLREGSSLTDFHAPPFTIVGEATPGAGALAERLYAGVNAPLHHCSLETAEAIKYVSNSFHALKVAFANEVGVLLKALEVDSHAVMDLVCRDTKLNISPAYLTPGNAFGGSCLPKDLRALLSAARERNLETPLLAHVLPSNDAHLERIVGIVLETQERDVALLGLSFKAGTDDLRESPLVRLAERLIGKGCRLRIWDPDVRLGFLTGANRAFIEQELPHIADLLVPGLDQALQGARVTVVGSRRCDLDRLGSWAREGTLIDLVRLPDHIARSARVYHGICW